MRWRNKTDREQDVHRRVSMDDESGGISDLGYETPVFYMNITKMTWYRTDGHPSVYRQPVEVRGSSPATGMFQDCSHWCLPGIPDSWNQLLYASFAWFLVLQVSWYSLLKWWLVLLSLFDQPLVFDLCKFFFFEKKH